MNQAPAPQKDRVMKTLAIFGFLAVIIIGVWLAVQIVNLVPQAFSSLASIADGVYNYQGDPELMVETENSVVTSNTPFMITWNKITQAGAFTFAYACTEGVSLTLRDNTGSLINQPCGENITLGNTMTDLEVTIASERNRFVDVPYTVAFYNRGETEPVVTSDNSISIVNPSIPEGGIVAGVDADNEVEEPAEEVPAVVEKPTAPSTPTPQPPRPTVVETIVMQTPVSDPNGQTDLAVRLVGVGHLASNGNFIPRGNIKTDARGAFQFEVRNIGTKTSTEWDFIAKLTSGTDYDAPAQNPLKPQERVLFTLGFDNVGDDGINLIGVTVRGGGDTKPANNSFSWAVSVVD